MPRESQNMKKANNWKSYAAEFLGTAVMILIGLSAVCVNFGAGSPVPALIPALRLRLLLTGFIFAGGGALVVYSPLGSLSGGHLNPAVTLAFLLQKKMRARDAAIYMAAQAAGAAAGALAVLRLWGEIAVSARLGMTLVRPGFSLTAAALLEAGMTAGLVLLIFYMGAERRRARFTGLAAGLLVWLFVFLEAPLTGTGINPARSLGPAAALGMYYGQLWLYLLAPLFGAAAAVFVYNLAGRLRGPLCGKLYHRMPDPACLFLDCGFKPGNRREETHVAR